MYLSRSQACPGGAPTRQSCALAHNSQLKSVGQPSSPVDAYTGCRESIKVNRSAGSRTQFKGVSSKSKGRRAARLGRPSWNCLLALVGLDHRIDLFLHSVEVKRSRVLHRRIVDGRWAGDEVYLVGDYDSSELYEESRSYRNISRELAHTWNSFIEIEDMQLKYNPDCSCQTFVEVKQQCVLAGGDPNCPQQFRDEPSGRQQRCHIDDQQPVTGGIGTCANFSRL